MHTTTTTQTATALQAAPQGFWLRHNLKVSLRRNKPGVLWLRHDLMVSLRRSKLGVLWLRHDLMVSLRRNKLGVLWLRHDLTVSLAATTPKRLVVSPLLYQLSYLAT
jgi:hypothetical protein